MKPENEEKESLQTASGLEFIVRPHDVAAAPTGTLHLFLDNLEEAGEAGQGLRGFVQEDAPDARRCRYDAQVSSEVYTSTLV